MEVTLSHINSHQFCTSLYKPTAKKLSISSSQPFHNHHGCLLTGCELRSNYRPVLGLECAKGGPVMVPVPELEKELEEEDIKMNSEEEWEGIGGRWMEKCKGKGGIVELMECLEREAIMGEDEGRKPTDYHRRAHIFDKSSRVFQALKEHTNPQSS